MWDLLGLAFIAFSLIQSDMVKLRLASLGVCGYYIGYAALTDNQALLAPNALIAAIHVFALFKERKENESYA